MSKIEFHEITLDDKTWMDARFQEDDRNACEYTFANNFVWRKVYHVEVAEKYGCAIIRFEEEGVVMYSYPIGPLCFFHHRGQNRTLTLCSAVIITASISDSRICTCLHTV